jgi:hypothetical protein
MDHYGHWLCGLLLADCIDFRRERGNLGLRLLKRGLHLRLLFGVLSGQTALVKRIYASQQ